MKKKGEGKTMSKGVFQKWYNRIMEASLELTKLEKIVDELEQMGLDKIRASWTFINNDPQDLCDENRALYLLGAAYAIYDELQIMCES